MKRNLIFQIQALEQVEEWLLQKLRTDQFNSIIISDYEKGFCRKDLCQMLITLANQMDIPIIVDPKGKNWEKYSKATMITPNIKELSEIVRN